MIHLIIGNTGSGKTTYSNELKQKTNGIVFSIDKWNKTLFLPDKKSDDGLEWFLERIDRAENLIKDLIVQLEKSKTDSILDLGLARFEHREKFRKFASSAFYQDISRWCVKNIASEPPGFSRSSFPSEYKPKWGTCPD